MTTRCRPSTMASAACARSDVPSRERGVCTAALNRWRSPGRAAPPPSTYASTSCTTSGRSSRCELKTARARLIASCHHGLPGVIATTRTSAGSLASRPQSACSVSGGCSITASIPQPALARYGVNPSQRAAPTSERGGYVVVSSRMRFGDAASPASTSRGSHIAPRGNRSFVLPVVTSFGAPRRSVRPPGRPIPPDVVRCRTVARRRPAPGASRDRGRAGWCPR